MNKGTSLLSYTYIQWGMVIFLFIFEFIWIQFSSLLFLYDKKLFFAVGILLLILFVYILYKRFRPDPIILNLLQFSCLFLAFGPLMVILSYLGATINHPLVDVTLASLDSYVEIYTPAVVFWFRSKGTVYSIFSIIYDSYFLQFLFILFYFSFRKKELILQRYIMQFMIAALLTITISAFLPAAGPFVFYHYPPSAALLSALNHFQELRHNILDIKSPDGLVMFPSFHTIIACIDTYAFRNERKFIFILILILNILVIFSCIPIGQHYFADILGGIAVFLVTVGIEVLLFKVVTRKKSIPQFLKTLSSP